MARIDVRVGQPVCVRSGAGEWPGLVARVHEGAEPGMIDVVVWRQHRWVEVGGVPFLKGENEFGYTWVRP